MTITMGQLVSEVFEAYERRYGDTELAAVATEVTVDDIIRTVSQRRSRSRKAAPGRGTRTRS
jgi:hypothetical protein